jgi:UPF0716 protein FxsA
MIGRLFLLFTVGSFVELYLLLKVGALIGTPATIGLVLLTAFVGARLIRRVGGQTMQKLREDLAAGRVPTEALADGLCVLIAGALLITPGVLTDLTGLALLWGPTRRLARGVMVRWLRRWFKVRVASPGGGFGTVFTAGGFGRASRGFGGGARGGRQASRADVFEGDFTSSSRGGDQARVYRPGDVIDVTRDTSGGG